VRKEVFVGEQGVPEDIEYDAYDAVAVHVLAVREDGVPLGTGRLLHGRAAVDGRSAAVAALPVGVHRNVCPDLRWGDRHS
jgi:predicted GNAT family N-acyltransferase